MFSEPDAQHHQPHFHTKYQESHATFAIETLAILVGGLPAPQRRLVEAWATIHQDELMVNWALLISGRPPFKIEPLV